MSYQRNYLAGMAMVILLFGAPAITVAADLKEQAAQAMSAREFKTAAELYRRVIKESPEDGMAHYRLGIVLMNLEDLEGSASHFERAGELGFQPLGVGFRLARIRSRQGHLDTALELLEDIAKKGFSIPQLLENESDFDPLRESDRFGAVLVTVTAARFPCKGNPKNRAFDFWDGHWDVSYQGAPAGKSEIKTILGDCVLFENWTSVQGTTGKSFNYYDAAEGHWRQIWVDDSGGVIEFTGQFEQGVLHYTAQTKTPDGGKLLHQLNFSRNPDGSVRQHWLTSNDGGKSWQEAFDGHYVHPGS
jgi:tetratricopeptide (TPR) repeat protein